MAAYRTPTERAEECLFEFVRQAWPIVEPDTKFQTNWHIESICRHLEAVTTGDIMNLLINIPPGFMKSLLCCVFWPAWVWISNPAARFLFASYDAALSQRDSVRCRYVVESDWYQTLWGKRFGLVGDQNQKTRYDTTERGWRIATSVGGRGTGEHPDYVITDDPHNAKKAESPADRQTVRDWWDGTISSRGVIRNVRRLIVMQRLKEDDLSGHAIKKGGFEHLCLPMRFESDRRTATSIGWSDPRQKDGELLWPEIFTEQKVKTLERDMGPIVAAAQLQQRPSSASGMFFDVSKLTFVPVAPAGLKRMVRAWDFAATDDAGDYTAGVKMAVDDDGVYYVTDVKRGQWGTDERRSQVKLTASLDGRKVRIRGPQDPGSAGKDGSLDFIRMLAGFSVKTQLVTGSKRSRATPFQSQLNGGNVRIVEGTWNQEYVDELKAFDGGLNDDQVDASADAFNELTSKRQFLVGTG